jgi:hypothetical protein
MTNEQDEPTTVDIVELSARNANLGNVVKYLARCDHKGNAVEDLKKALWYLQRELDRRQA